jgi:hypothetical protein
VLRLDGALGGNRARRWGKSKAVSSHRSPRNQNPESHAKTRRRGGLGINKGVLECSGLTELGMRWSASIGKIQSGVKPPQSKKQGSGISREDAKVRKGWDRVPQLPKKFCGHEGCLGVLRLDGALDGVERADGEIQSGVKPPQSKKPRIRNLTRRRGDAKGWGLIRVSWSAPA